MCNAAVRCVAIRPRSPPSRAIACPASRAVVSLAGRAHTVMYIVAKTQPVPREPPLALHSAKVSCRQPSEKTTMESAAEALSAHELVAGHIRDAILNQKLQPGDRLVEDRLAERFDVSRHPVREALRTLQLEGLVDISPRRGATVARISAQDATEMFEVLAPLDGLAARLAADACDTTTAARITAVLEEASALLESGNGEYNPGDLEHLTDLSREFHRLAALASGNRHLIDTIAPLRDRVRSTQDAMANRPPEQSWREHREMFDAIQSKDGAVAEQLARAHVDAARRHLEQISRPDSTDPDEPRERHHTANR